MTEDFNDDRFAGRIGKVAEVSEDRDHIYPHGRVAVLLKVDELYSRLYHPDKPPNPVWFKPNYLEKI